MCLFRTSVSPAFGSRHVPLDVEGLGPFLGDLRPYPGGSPVRGLAWSTEQEGSPTGARTPVSRGTSRVFGRFGPPSGGPPEGPIQRKRRRCGPPALRLRCPLALQWISLLSVMATVGMVTGPLRKQALVRMSLLMLFPIAFGQKTDQKYPPYYNLLS